MGELVEGEVYAGADRHTGEIAAFHLSRLLALPMVPLTVGRQVSPRKHLLPVASKELAATFFKKRGMFFPLYVWNGGILTGMVKLRLPFLFALISVFSADASNSCYCIETKTIIPVL